MDMKISGKVSRFSKPDRTFVAKGTGLMSRVGPFENINFIEPQKKDGLVDISISASGSPAEIAINSSASLTLSALPEIPCMVKLTGVLRPDSGAFVIDSLAAFSGENSISLTGSAENLWSDERAASLGGTANITADELAPSLGAKGLATANIEIAASMQGIDVQTDVDLTKAAFTIPRLASKESGTKSSLTASSRIIIPDAVVVDAVEFTIEDAKINGSGRVNPTSEPWALFSFSASDFPLKRLNRLPSVSFEHGSLDISAELRRQSRAEKEVKYNGDALVANALLHAIPLREPVQIDDLHVAFENNIAVASSNSFSFAGSVCSLTAEIMEFSRPYVKGRLHADSLDVKKIAAAFAGPESESESDRNPSTPRTDTEREN
jgi:hypothetical protein